MLDLTARYKPGQETSHIKSVTPGNNFRKPAGKNDGFNRILNKTRQRSQDMKSVNTESDKTSDQRKFKNISACPTRLDKSPKKPDVVPTDADNPNCVCQSKSDQSVQLSSATIGQETSKQNQGSAKDENNVAALTNMSQAECVEAEDQSSLVGLHATISSPESKKPSDSQVEVPINELQTLTTVPAQQAGNIIISKQIGSEVDMGSSSLLLNELKEGGQNFPVSQSATYVQTIDIRLAAPPDSIATDIAAPGQQTENQAISMEFEQQESNLTAAVQREMADLPKNQANNVVAPVLADGRLASNTDKGELDIVVRAQEMDAAVIIKSQLSNQQDPANPESSTAGEAEDAKPKKDNRALDQENLRFKMIEKNLLDSKKPDEKQPATDIKKIMLSESQRLSAARPVTEATAQTQTTAAGSEAEIMPTTVSGLEKVSNTIVRTGLESQTAASQSPAANVDPQDLIEQIVKKAEILSKASNYEMRIQLKPEFMGKMIIKIAVEDGLVTAKFITESQHVKHLLEANLGSLRQNLEVQGLRVDRTEVNVQLDNGGSFHGNDSGRQQMWEEYADRNAYNRFNQSNGTDYQPGDEATLAPYTEMATVDPVNLLADGKVDFMI